MKCLKCLWEWELRYAHVGKCSDGTRVIECPACGSIQKASCLEVKHEERQKDLRHASPRDV